MGYPMVDHALCGLGPFTAGALAALRRMADAHLRRFCPRATPCRAVRPRLLHHAWRACPQLRRISCSRPRDNRLGGESEVREYLLRGRLLGNRREHTHAAAAPPAAEDVDRVGSMEELRPVDARRGGQQKSTEESLEVAHGDAEVCDLDIGAGEDVGAVCRLHRGCAAIAGGSGHAAAASGTSERGSPADGVQPDGYRRPAHYRAFWTEHVDRLEQLLEKMDE
jgi:hypothetical protein